MKVAISSGHSLKVRGASGILDEVNEARRVVARVKELLGNNCITFNDDISKTQAENLRAIVGFHNARTRDLDVSIHFNASQSTSSPMGVEVLYLTESTLAAKISGGVAKAGGFKDRGAKKRTDLAFLNGTTKPAVLIEVCFVDSTADAELYKKNFDGVCRAIAETISGVAIPTNAPQVAKTPIMGKSVCTAVQLDAFAKKNNPNAPSYGAMYLEEGEYEGVRGDLAFCQSCWETGYFKFGGDVKSTQNNFAGLGATGTASGAAFFTPREGVRAQIQHLKAYACKDLLKGVCVDSRFSLVPRGTSPNWEDLNGKWAVPGASYGENIVKLWEGAKTMKTANEITVDNAIADGIIGDKAYWLAVLDGNKAADPSYIKKIFDDVHAKLLK